MSFLRLARHGMLAAFAAGFLVYLPHVANEFIGIDDPRFIIQNPLLQSITPTAIARAFASFTMLLYLPLTIVSYQINAAIAGTEPWVYHLTDALLHGLNAALCAALLRRLSGNAWVALIAGILFAVHPLQAEAVLWASSRKDLLSTAFALGSSIAYVRWLDDGNSTLRRWSVALFLLGMLAKVSIFPLPIAFLLFDLQRDRKGIVKLSIEKWPYAIIGIPLLLAGAYAGRQFLAPLGIGDFMVLAGSSVGYYLSALVWPLQLSLLHYQPEPVTIGILTVLGWAVVLGAASFIAWSLGTGRYRTSAAGVGFALLLLFPTFAAAQKGGLLFFASDKYVYLPMIGILLALMPLFLRVWRSRFAMLASIALALVVVSHIGITTLYARQWKNAERLYGSILAADPANPVALSSLGLLQLQRKNTGSALASFEASIATAPTYIAPRINAASTLRSMGRMQEALEMLLHIEPALTERQVLGDPTLREALPKVAKLLANNGHTSEAASLLLRVSMLAPSAPEAYEGLGDLLLMQGKESEAFAAYENAAKYGSENKDVYYRLAEAYSKQNRIDDVIRMLERAVELDPDNGTAQEQLLIFQRLQQSR